MQHKLMQRRLFSLFTALFICLYAMLPSFAWAAEATSVSNASTNASTEVDSDTSSVSEASETSQLNSAFKSAYTSADISTDNVAVSYDNVAASQKGEDETFALDEFERANVGSNRNIADEYYGYAYYIGKKPVQLMYMVTNKALVVYVDQSLVDDLGGLDSQESITPLQEVIQAINEANASGSASIPSDVPWYFTSSNKFILDGVVYSFLEEIDGSYYNTISGTAGEDVTASDSEYYTKPLFACFSSVVTVEDAHFVSEPAWYEKLGSFMSVLDWSPLFVTLKTTLTAIIFIFVLGLACAYLCLHVSPRVRDILDTIFTIPMVLPPTVCGFLLLLLLGSNTALGRWFISVGFPLIFSWPATVIAAVVVAFPLMYRNALGAFENLDPNMLDAARTLGWKETRIFFRIMLPLSWSSIAAGTVLAFARALGEFGATLFLAGNYLGITRTIPIAIYFEWMNGNTDVAIFWTIILVIFSFIVIAFINLWSRHTTRYRKGAIEE